MSTNLGALSHIRHEASLTVYQSGRLDLNLQSQMSLDVQRCWPLQVYLVVRASALQPCACYSCGSPAQVEASMDDPCNLHDLRGGRVVFSCHLFLSRPPSIRSLHIVRLYNKSNSKYEFFSGMWQYPIKYLPFRGDRAIFSSLVLTSCSTDGKPSIQTYLSGSGRCTDQDH